MTKYFTAGKGKDSFELTGTTIEPKPLVFLGKHFSKKYRMQLDNLILGDFDLKAMMPLLMLAEAVDKDEYPVSIRASLGKKQIGKVVDVLNDFFEENYSIILPIYRMYVDSLNKTRRKNIQEAESNKEKLRGLNTVKVTHDE